MNGSQVRLVDSNNLHKFEYPPLPGAKTKSTADEKSNTQLPTPYIQLLARLSQSWLNYWTILLLLVLFRLLFVTQHLKQSLADGQVDVNIACREVQSAASTAVSMPHYLTQGVNALIKLGIDEAVAGMSLTVRGLLTAVEALVLFFINAFKSTYLCLLKLAVGGALDVVADAVEDVGKFVNATLAEISSDIDEGISDANKAINGVASAIEKAAKLLGETIDLPTVSIPDIGTVTIPDDFSAGLEKLKDSINLDSVQNATDAVIEYPFEKLKSLVNDTFAEYSFNQSVLSVPATEKLTFCSDAGLNKTFHAFEEAVVVSYHVLIGVLIVAALLAMVPHAWLEWERWKALVIGSSVESRAIKLAPPADSIELTTTVTHPLQSLLGIYAAKRFESQRSKNLTRWFIAYVTHSPAALVFLLGIAGLLACALQGLLLNALLRASPTISQDIGDVSTLVYQKLQNSSAAWANHTNGQIGIEQTVLNKELFGWVNTSTTAVNNTLNTFTDTLVGVLNDTFGGTILYTPILDVLDCIILLKIAGIEKGLTWVHDQANINLPRVAPDALGVTTADTAAMLDSFDTTTTAQVQHVIDDIASLWRSSIKQEAAIAGALVCAWLLVALAGLARVLLTSKRKIASKTPFVTSCFVDDIKTCISRPRQAPSMHTLDDQDPERDYSTEKARKGSEATSIGGEVESVTVVEEYGQVGQLRQMSHPRYAIKSVHGMVFK